MDKIIITIAREYGSGGREIGEVLADRLNIPFYDKALLSRASEESGIGEIFFKRNDEKSNSNFFQSILHGGYSGELPFHHQVFIAQFEAIKSIAKEGSCVIVGRCADYALRDEENVINIFLTADDEERIKRLIEVYGVAEKDAKAQIKKVDKDRANYYEFYTAHEWKDPDNFDLVIDTSKIGVEGVVELLIKYIEMRK